MLSAAEREQIANAPSVHSEEQAHFRRFASTWWDANGPFWPLHRLNELRVAWIVEQLQKAGIGSKTSAMPLAGLKVLDIGCGGGILSESLARLGASVTGTDVIERNIQIARDHAAESGLDICYRVQTPENLAASGQQFDVLFNMEVVEHVADLTSFFKACNQMVRPGGVTFVATINRSFKAWLFAILGAEYVLRWLPRGTHHYRMLRKPSEVENHLRAGGIEANSWTGVRVNPFTRRFSFQADTSVNYMLMAKKRLG